MQLVRVTWTLVLALAVPAQESRPQLPADPVAALREMPVAEPAAGGRSVLVADDETGAPVAGADVFLVDEQRVRRLETEHRQALEQYLPRWGAEQRHAAMLWAAGTRYRTGAAGTVLVAREGGSVIFACSGDRTGGGMLGPMPEGGWTIRIEAPRFVDVLVVDARGKPAKGVSLQLGTVAEGIRATRLVAFSQAVTDENGTARIARNGPGAGRPAQGQPLVVEADVAGAAAPLRIPVDTAPAASRPPLRLQLPPTGQVRVLVYDAGDRLRGGVQNVSLRRVDGDRSAWSGSSASRREPEGAWFDRVVLGARFEAVVQVASQSGQLRVQQAGPTREGELVVFTVRMNAGDPIVKLRLFDAAGKALAKQEVYSFLWNATTYDGRQVTTDADGRIEVVVPAKVAESDDARLVLYRRGASQQWSEYRDGCSLALGAGLAGVVDRGEARMQEEPALLSGVVVDAAGKPVPDVAIAAQMSFNQTGSGGWGGSGPGRWTDHRVRTDARGRFELRETAPKPVALDLRIDTPGWILAEPSSAVPGTKDLELVATRACEIRLTLRDGAELGPELDLRLHAQRRGDPTGRYEARLERGGYRLANLRPGTYDLAVGNEKYPAFSIDGLDLVSGESCADPRLRDADWSASMRKIRIAVQGLDGRAGKFRGIIVTKEGMTGWRGTSWSTDDQGRATVLVAKERGAIKLEHPDCVTFFAADPDHDLAIRLVPRPRVRVRLQEGVELPAGILVHVEPKLDEEESGRRMQTFSRQPPAAWQPGKDLVLRPDGTGTMRVRLVQAQGSSHTELWSGEVEVSAGPGLSHVTLPLDAAAAQKLADDVRRNEERGGPGPRRGR